MENTEKVFYRHAECTNEYGSVFGSIDVVFEKRNNVDITQRNGDVWNQGFDIKAPIELAKFYTDKPVLPWRSNTSVNDIVNSADALYKNLLRLCDKHIK